MPGTEARFQNAPQPGEVDQYGSQLNLNNGFSSLPFRTGVTQQALVASQALNLSYFRAPRYLHSVAAKPFSGSTAAAATPTLIRYGLWTVDPLTGALLALVASTPNDTTLFLVANTGYSKNWSVPYDFIKGQWYAAGLLIVSAAVLPTVFGINGTNQFIVNGALPRIAGTVLAQADLPATVAAGSISTATGTGRLYFEFS